MRTLALTFLLLTSLSAFATTATTAITGRVMIGGAPAAGVTVTATSPSLQGERTTVTTANGRYWLTALPAGEYDVAFSRAGMSTLIKTATVAVARVARVDAALEPSEDEESVTSTAKVVGVADTTAITTHFDDTTLDRLPVRRDPATAAFLSPGGSFSTVLQDDAYTFTGDIPLEESLEQMTVLRGGLTPDYEFAPAVIHGRTRSGGEDFSFSLRDSLTSGDWLGNSLPDQEDGVHHFFEGAAGGRIIPQKLWFFANAWHGSEWFGVDRHGALGKLTAQLGASHNLTALYDRGGADTTFYEAHTELATLRYLGTAGPRWTNEAVVSHAAFRVDEPQSGPGINDFDHDAVFAKTTYVLGTGFGDHILSAGVHATDDEFYDSTAVFANDRWVWDRLTVNLGVRHDDDAGTMPRVAASYDLRGDGRHAIVATVSDYDFGNGTGRDLTLGYATALGNGGMARIDAVRRDFGTDTFDSVNFELRYSLFDRFQAAAHYSWNETDAPVQAPTHVGNAWITVALPVGTHEFAVTVLERFRSEIRPFLENDWATDLALRYSLPVRRVGLTVAADVINVFDQRAVEFAIGRSYRGWIRVRL